MFLYIYTGTDTTFGFFLYMLYVHTSKTRETLKTIHETVSPSLALFLTNSGFDELL